MRGAARSDCHTFVVVTVSGRHRESRFHAHRRAPPAAFFARELTDSTGRMDGTGYPTRKWGVDFCGTVL
jgi:hypothetical protein